jgi:DnaJ domain
MNQPGNAGFAYDYALLRAAPGCDLDELKRCYRLAVRDLHPDRNPELAANSAAQDALSELTTAYRRLLDYHRAYGRLPGESLRRPAAPADPVAVPAATVPAAADAPATDARGFKDPYGDPAATVRRSVRIGDTKLKVRAILGPPILGTAEVWEYGPSHVRFEDGRVIDWYSSPLTPIAVDESSRRRGAGGKPKAE